MPVSPFRQFSSACPLVQALLRVFFTPVLRPPALEDAVFCFRLPAAVPVDFAAAFCAAFAAASAAAAYLSA